MSGGPKTAGEKNGNWRGGRSLASNGYVLIRVGAGHPLADVRGYAYEHRIVASKRLGRWLQHDEHVYHKDENKLNNLPENLEVLTAAEHHLRHRVTNKRLRLPGETNPDVTCECGCGSAFPLFDSAGRPRRFVSGHNPPLSPTVDAIVATLRASSARRSDLYLAIPATDRAIANCLSRLKRAGKVANENGIWRLLG